MKFTLDLFIKFDKPVLIKYLYLRPHKTTNTHAQYSFDVIGYKNEQVIFTIRENAILAHKQWV